MTFTSVQGLRFIAALLVLLFHLGIFYSGYKGVDLFFVISGFVIYYSTHSSIAGNTSLQRRKFLINRFSKIFLLYWTSLLVLYIVAPYPANLETLGSFLLLPGHKNILGVSWSLSYELYFYCLCFILFFVLNSKIANLFLRIAFAISFVLTVAQLTPWSLKGSWINFFAGHNLWEFLLGIMVGKIFLRQKRMNMRPFVLLLVVSSGAMIIASMKYNSAGSYLVYGILSFFMVLAAVETEKQFPFPSIFSKVINALGDASYAIYLFSPIIIIVFRTCHFSNIFIIPTVIIISYLIHFFYEAPLLKYIRRKNIPQPNR
jgi:exopolysaccharide production protein ExoZ